MTAVVPTLRSCLTWALRIGLATALAIQLPYTSDYAPIGTRLLGAIGLVLAARVGSPRFANHFPAVAGNTVFQSSFILTTVQPLATASSHALLNCCTLSVRS